MKRFLAVVAGSVTAVVFNTTAFAQAGSSNNDALMLLLDQFQDIRNEMQTLRGMVEEHGYEIRRLQQDSLDRYTNLDARISALYQDLEAARTAGVTIGAGTGTSSNPATTAASGTNAAASANTGTTGSATNSVSLPSTSASSGSQAAASPSQASAQSVSNNVSTPATTGMLTEQQLYELALDSLLQQEAYQRSVQEFDQYLAEYPDGRFVTNAYYWKGQAYVNLSMFDQARVAFETILDQYPDGRKIEDAMYSLGTVYHRLGDNARARQLLQEVRARFPNTSAANLADIYMRSLN